MSVTLRNGSLTLVPVRFVPPLRRRDVKPSRSATFQRLGRDVVDAIARAGWDLPGMDVTLRASGSGRDTSRYVASVRGRTADGPFRLTFEMMQDRPDGGGFRNGLSKAAFPHEGGGLEVEFKAADTFPNAALYVGGDWAAEGDAFVDDHKVNSRTLGGSRRHVKYAYRDGVLLPDDDMGREHEATEEDPASLAWADVVAASERFLASLRDGLATLPPKAGHDDLAKEGDANLRRLLHVDPVPVPDGFPRRLYSWVSDFHARRLSGEVDGSSGWHEYGLSGNDKALFGMGHLGPRAEGLHPRAFDGFSYASSDPAVKAGHCLHGDGDYPVVVELRSLDEVYVVDNAVFERARQETFARMEGDGDKRMSDRQLDACVAEVATSFVRAVDYDGSYAEPQYLLGRQLGPDEARLMRGEVRYDEREERVTLSGPDGEATLHVRHGSYRDADKAERVAASAARFARAAERAKRPSHVEEPEEAPAMTP